MVGTPSSERARVAILTRKRPAGHPDIEEARRRLAEANISQYVERVVAKAPPLTTEQRDRIAALLRPVAS